MPIKDSMRPNWRNLHYFAIEMYSFREAEQSHLKEDGVIEWSERLPEKSIAATFGLGMGGRRA